MAKFQCKCGTVLSNNTSPHNVQLRVFTDFEWDELTDMGQIDAAALPNPKRDVWRCPTCDRIYVFENDKLAKTYEPASS